MKQSTALGVPFVASLALAACGGAGGASESPPGSAGRGPTIAVRSIDGVGHLLVDSGGKALYASDVEADGEVRCVGGCESFWKPLRVGAGMPTGASPSVGRLAVIRRPDGSRQVALAGKPLYTFSDDSAGQVKGIGFQDDFNGRHFTWSAVLAGGSLATAAGSSSGYPSGSDDGY